MDETRAVEKNSLLAGRGDAVISARSADVGARREALRRRRLWRLALVLAIPTAWLWYHVASGTPAHVPVPHVDTTVLLMLILVVALVGSLVLPYWWVGRSPHVLYRPEQIPTRLADVKGIDPIKEEVVRSLNLFLAYKTFASEMGGTPRRGLLFEGAPGTGKTFLAKAMAAEAGVPFLFVSGTAFQSMFYGATARKIRTFFKELRKAARQEGGAIGFIEEIDAIGGTRGGMRATAAPDGLAPYRIPGTSFSDATVPSYLPASYRLPMTITQSMMNEGSSGVVNELLVQMQSFDDPVGWQRMWSSLVDTINLLLPSDHQIKRPVPPSTNVLLIAATNRADNLDPALLRPGRFDRRLTFELPSKAGRREIIDHYLAKKSHATELDRDELRDALSGVTQGYTPVMIEHLLDEALVSALRRGEHAMTWRDVEHARLTEEVGLGQPVAYTDHERRLIATHEAGHATVAWLVAPQRRLEILTIVKRRQALGLLAHGDAEDVFTRSRRELLALIEIAFGGQVAEELFFGDVSTGPSGDLAYATNVAAEMIGAAGMAGSLVSYAAIQNTGFSDTNIVGRVLADKDTRARVEHLLQEQKGHVRELLGQHRHLVEALRDALLEHEELIGREINDVLEAAAASAPTAARPVCLDSDVIELPEPAV